MVTRIVQFINSSQISKQDSRKSCHRSSTNWLSNSVRILRMMSKLSLNLWSLTGLLQPPIESAAQRKSPRVLPISPAHHHRLSLLADNSRSECVYSPSLLCRLSIDMSAPVSQHPCHGMAGSRLAEEYRLVRSVFSHISLRKPRSFVATAVATPVEWYAGQNNLPRLHWPYSWCSRYC